jgi:hypothetical protein
LDRHAGHKEEDRTESAATPLLCADAPGMDDDGQMMPLTVSKCSLSDSLTFSAPRQFKNNGIHNHDISKCVRATRTAVSHRKDSIPDSLDSDTPVTF